MRFSVKKDDFEQRFNAALREADRQGIPSPVVTVYQPTSPRARQIYVDVHGRPMPARWRPRRHGPGPVDALAVPQAVDMLRRRAGVGGAAVAALLMETTPLRPDHWMVVLYGSHLAVGAFGGGELLLTGRIEY